METKDYYETCEKCGRPFNYAPTCPHTCGCGLKEYKYNVSGCIRNKNPECPYNAVIASVTIPTKDGISNLADCFVHVVDINTTYYIDDKHRIMTIWAGPVEVTEYDTTENPLGLRSQWLLQTSTGVMTYFDKQGTPVALGNGG